MHGRDILAFSNASRFAGRSTLHVRHGRYVALLRAVARQFAVAVKLTTLLIAPVDAVNGTVRYIVCATAEP